MQQKSPTPYEEPTTPKKYQIKILAFVGFLGYNKSDTANKNWNYCFRLFRVYVPYFQA